MLNWRTITPAHDPKFLVRGTELSVAIVPGHHSRFQICEIRTYIRLDNGYECDREYAIRDADKVSDQDVREGKRPPIVGRFASLDEALAALPAVTDL